MSLLHGDLEVEVVGAANLFDADGALWHVTRGDHSDCSVEVTLGGQRVLTTSVRDNVINTHWGEHASLPVCHVASHLDVAVWDKDYLRCELVGRGRLVLGAPDRAWTKEGPVFLEGGKGRVDLKVKFTPASFAAHEGIELPKSYFPMRKGGSLTLYQDAHATSLPGLPPVTEGSFEAIARSIRGAKKFVYIAGWSVWTGTRLERDRKETLGEMLKAKAAEGVRVLLLLWDEKFSSVLCAGLMGTHDAATEHYFEDSAVHVAKVRRQKSSVRAVREELVEAVWTHHQKAILTDDEADGVVAFVGGLDLTNGRWDTPGHELFSTLNKEHRGDFHNGFTSVPPEQGPREPWHDIHARLTGPAALDVLTNFEERWIKQVPEETNLLLPTPKLDVALTSEESDDASWQMQVVRSIDANSASFGGRRIGALDSWDGRTVDTSLHKALVRLIRRAENFLYIESQYFIGSSDSWDEDSDVNARNLIPLEIAQRVANKIRAGQGFRVYVVLPMIPEGNPENRIHKGSMKAIMRFQFLTLQMMYQKIAEALKEVGSKAHPTDFLLPLCLAKQESKSHASRSSNLEEPEEGSEAWRWRQKSKFLIYVHSKMAIADDAHVIVGSANLNERSLEGTRDTEIAVSACQIRQDGSQEVVNDGAVREFRRALWSEHTWGISEEERGVLGEPGSLLAIRRIKQLADNALESFAGGRPETHRCRFLRYPLAVDVEGNVGPIPGMEKVPGFDLSVVGGSTYIPAIATS